MQKRNSLQANPRKPRKNSGKPTRKFIEKFENKAWVCGICNQQNDPLYPYCLQCYLDLHYYAYVNMHLFVTHDDSYQETYYHMKSVEKDCDNISSWTNDTDSDHEEENEHLAIDFVEHLLDDE